MIKLDWYDPNTKTAGNQIGAASSNFTATNIKYTTFGFGYINYLTDNVKIVLYYAKVTNEKTQLPGFTPMLKMMCLPAGCNSGFNFQSHNIPVT